MQNFIKCIHRIGQIIKYIQYTLGKKRISVQYLHISYSTHFSFLLSGHRLDL